METHRLIGSDRVMGTVVYGVDNRRVGTIRRLAIEKASGQVAYAVMSFGGLFGVGAETHIIPWAKLHYASDLGGYRTDITECELRDAPDFGGKDGADLPDRDQERALHDYYGVRHYWSV